MCEDRLIYLDLLRVAASFFVIMLHVSATDWASVSVYSWVWEIYNGYDSLARWAVPAFVMISGCFFLDGKKEMPLKKIAQKYIWRLVKGFFFWSVLYAGMNCCIALYRGMRGDDLIWTFLQMVLRGHYHLWFIYMMIGLYLITPFLRPIARSKKLLEYFLLLGYIFAIIIPMARYIPFLNSVGGITSSMHMYFVLGYPLYFVAGYYLHTYPIGKWKRLVYVLGVCGAVATIVGTSMLSHYGNSPSIVFYEHFTPNCFAVSLAIFVFCQEELAKIRWSARMKQGIVLLSQCSFGIYLVHDFYRAIIMKAFTITKSCAAIWSIPLVTLIIFVFSFGTIYLMRKIPILRRNVL